MRPGVVIVVQGHTAQDVRCVSPGRRLPGGAHPDWWVVGRDERIPADLSLHGFAATQPCELSDGRLGAIVCGEWDRILMRSLCAPGRLHFAGYGAGALPAPVDAMGGPPQTAGVQVRLGATSVLL